MGRTKKLTCTVELSLDVESICAMEVSSRNSFAIELISTVELSLEWIYFYDGAISAIDIISIVESNSPIASISTVESTHSTDCISTIDSIST